MRSVRAPPASRKVYRASRRAVCFTRRMFRMFTLTWVKFGPSDGSESSGTTGLVRRLGIRGR